jgi:uncharacterized protein YbjT (DUF2867 family)
MSGIKSIAVIGATGMLGLPVARALLDAGFEVTALVRNPEAARRALPPEVKLAKADVRDEESLRRGLKGCDALYLNLSVQPGERQSDFHTEAQGLVHIIDAARTAGIRRIGYLSALVVDAENANGWWVVEVWRAAVRRLKESGIPTMIFYASNVMETIPERHRIGSVMVLAGASHHGNYWISGADLGAQVAHAFQREEAGNRDYFMQGPELVAYEEAGRRYARSRDEGLRVVALPLWLLRFLGLFSQAMRFNARMLSTVLRAPEEFRASDTWAALGRPTMTIEDFAKGD